MGGIWEQQICSGRKILRCLVSNQWIDDGRLKILFREVPNDSHDLVALTPDHLLRFNPSDDLPPRGSLKDDIYLASGNMPSISLTRSGNAEESTKSHQTDPQL